MQKMIFGYFQRSTIVTSDIHLDFYSSSFVVFVIFSASINAVPRVFLASNFLRKHGLRIIIVLQTKEDGIRFNYRYKTCVKNKTLGTDWITNIMTVKCVKSMNNNTSFYYLDLMIIFLFMAKYRNQTFEYLKYFPKVLYVVCLYIVARMKYYIFWPLNRILTSNIMLVPIKY